MMKRMRSTLFLVMVFTGFAHDAPTKNKEEIPIEASCEKPNLPGFEFSLDYCDQMSIIFPRGNKILFIPISGSGCSKIFILV